MASTRSRSAELKRLPTSGTPSRSATRSGHVCRAGAVLLVDGDDRTGGDEFTIRADRHRTVRCVPLAERASSATLAQLVDNRAMLLSPQWVAEEDECGNHAEAGRYPPGGHLDALDRLGGLEPDPATYPKAPITAPATKPPMPWPHLRTKDRMG